MDMPNMPLKGESPEVVIPPLKAADQLAAPATDDGSAPHVSNLSVPPQDLRVDNSRATEIPITELKRLAVAHGMSDHASVHQPTSHSRVYIFFAALLGIGAFIAWQSYGATEKLNAAPASSFSSPVSTEVASATPQLPTSTSGQGAADPTTQEAILSPPASDVPSSDTQRLDSIASELSVVRQELQQLAAKQEEMARNVATLSAAREKEKLPPPKASRGVSSQRKISSPPPLQVGALPPSPPPPPPSNRPATPDNGANIPRPPSSLPQN